MPTTSVALAQTEARVPIAALGNILLLTLLCFKSHTRPNVVASKSEEYRARAHDAEACALEVDDPDLKRQFEEIGQGVVSDGRAGRPRRLVAVGLIFYR